MAKSLTESAAEILKASLASAGKEPTAKLPGEEDDLGGATETQPDGGEVGKKAAAGVKQAAAPKGPEVAAEPAKKLANEEAVEEVEQIDEGDLSIRALYNKWADHYTSSDGNSAKRADAVEKTITRVHGHEVMSHLKKAISANLRNDMDQEENHFERARNAAEKSGSDRVNATVGKNRSKFRKEEVAGDEEVVAEEATEISEEELAEAKKKMKMDMVAKHKGSMAEDVNALFNGESLSEEFRTKATTIFEAAVQSRVEKIVEDIIDDNDAILEEAVEGIKVELAEQVDEYLNYVVEQWVTDNEVAIESGLRAELTEDFINGLKNLFAEHYIDLPEEKLEVAESLAERVVELEEQSELITTEFASVLEELNEAKKNEAIRKICEGLTEVQVGKMKSLAEGVEFTTEGEFNNKLAVIRENYFPNKKVVSEVTAAAETSEAQPEVEVPSYMSNYVKAISKTLPK